jgi:aryl-alcohol dehydrogenase-like predicted oxidoreductase
MSDMINRGRALYWGTSEWTADEIRAAYDIADRHNLHKPLMEQPQYNILWRDRVEKEYKRLYEDIGLGTTIWSPLSSGLLTGKYLNGVPEGSRATLPGYEWLKKSLTNKESNAKVAELKKISDSLDVSLAQFSLAWCAKNPNVSTVITGASSAEQVRENMSALDVIPLLTPEVMEKVDLVSLM